MTNLQQENISEQSTTVLKDKGTPKDSLINHDDEDVAALEEAIARLKHEGILTE